MKRWTGRVIGAWVVLLLAFDAAVKLFRLDVAVDATTKLGYPETLVAVIGLVEMVCLLVYVIPRTSTMGALLLTAYLGGATAPQVRVEDPWFVFPIVVAAMIWGALWFRDARVGELFFGTSTRDANTVRPQLCPSASHPS